VRTAGARRRVARLAVLAGLGAVLAASAPGAPDDAASDDRPALEIVSPTSADVPVGATTIRVFAKGVRPGDILDFFVDGRKVGSVSAPPWQVEWPAGETVRRHVLTVALLRGGREAATARVDTREPGFTARADAGAVALSPIVTDRWGRYVLGLKQTQFTVIDNQKTQRIETFDTVDSPLAVMLVLDVSTSMQPKIDRATRAARAFVGALKKDDLVGLLTFNTGVVGFVDVALDRRKVLEGIDACRPEGDTALYDAVAAAIGRLKSARQRKAVVVFTDGDDNRSRLSIGQVTEMARASEVSIYAIAEGTEQTPKLREFLDRLADETGGRFYSIESIGRLSKTFAEIVHELSSQYFLTYTPSDKKPRSWHTVEVKVDHPGAVVRARRQYRLP
jgi:Ca-activated chloride channel family protein